MSSQVVTWVLSIAATVAIPRYLGPELVGRFHLASSIWAMGLVVTAFGMDLALVKAVARDETRIASLLATSIAARLLLTIPVTIALFGYSVVAGYSNQLLILLVLVGIGTVVQTITGSVSAILKGLDKMGAMSVAVIVGRVVFVGGALILLALGYGIYSVAVVAGIGSIFTLVIQGWALHQVRTELGDTNPYSYDTSSIKELLRESLPYFWISFFIVVYLQVDTIVISLVTDREEVLGWYSVYDRLGGTLMFVPTVFMTAVYPTLSRIYAPGDDQENPEKHGQLTQKTFEVMLLISVPIGVGMMAISRPLVELLFGADFGNAAPVLAVGGIVISLTYLTTVLGMFLISMDRQREWTRFIALGATLTIPLDFLLVPFFENRYENGAIGGAVAYVITESIILSGAIYLLPRGALGPSSLRYVARVLTAGLILGAVVYPLRSLNLLVPVAVGAVAYGFAVLALGLIAPDDRRFLVASATGALARSRGRGR